MWGARGWVLWPLSNVGGSAAMRSCLVSRGKWLFNTPDLRPDSEFKVHFIRNETAAQHNLTPTKKCKVFTDGSTNLKSVRNLTNFWHDLNRVDVAPPGWGRSSLEVRMVLCVLCHLSLFWCISNIPDIYFSFVYTHVFTPSDLRLRLCFQCATFMATLNIFS